MPMSTLSLRSLDESSSWSKLPSAMYSVTMYNLSGDRWIPKYWTMFGWIVISKTVRESISSWTWLQKRSQLRSLESAFLVRPFDESLQFTSVWHHLPWNTVPKFPSPSLFIIVISPSYIVTRNAYTRKSCSRLGGFGSFLFSFFSLSSLPSRTKAVISFHKTPRKTGDNLSKRHRILFLPRSGFSMCWRSSTDEALHIFSRKLNIWLISKSGRFPLNRLFGHTLIFSGVFGAGGLTTSVLFFFWYILQHLSCCLFLYLSLFSSLRQ